MVMYEEANKAYNNCEEEVKDNLVKQAKTICNPSKEDFEKYFLQFGVDFVGQSHKEIGESIPKTMATQYMEVYKRISADLDQNIEQTEIKRSNGTASPEEIAFLGRLA
jgi:hypothetical protein